MSGQWVQCPDCVNCDECGAIAYCLADAVSFPPCAHDKALCGDCNLGACPDCRLEAEQELYAGDQYDPRKDPFYRPENEASDAAYWASGPSEDPKSAGTFRYPTKEQRRREADLEAIREGDRDAGGKYRQWADGEAEGEG